ncbi:hypothetical protein JKP88DRAFT_100880 [Tribonema minus]|uniref:Uncharacterized protein n=1 Tax=Tribonema minus TaxID=303371 RepID=A0A835YID1_9STRA|nr:hypothetical protein JKP88DRAFT_100880 [Tribonema minus]
MTHCHKDGSSQECEHVLGSGLLSSNRRVLRPILVCISLHGLYAAYIGSAHANYPLMAHVYSLRVARAASSEFAVTDYVIWTAVVVLNCKCASFMLNVCSDGAGAMG